MVGTFVSAVEETGFLTGVHFNSKSELMELL